MAPASLYRFDSWTTGCTTRSTSSSPATSGWAKVARLRMGAKCRDCLTERRPVGDVGGLTADRNRERGATSPADKRPSDERDDCGQESQWENFYWLRVGELRLSHVGLR
jgi:hypothetical protein